MQLVGNITALTNVGYPYATNDERTFEAGEVMAFAKSTSYGDSRTLFYVKLADGSLLYINASKQGKGAEKWLRRIARGVAARWASREAGWTFSWRDVTTSDAPTKAEENAGERAPVKHRSVICDNCGKDLGVSDGRRRDVFRAHWPYCPVNPDRKSGGKRRHSRESLADTLQSVRRALR